MSAEEALQGSLQIMSGNAISLVRVDLRALVKADLECMCSSSRAENHNAMSPFKHVTLGIGLPTFCNPIKSREIDKDSEREKATHSTSIDILYLY